jgi:hypothetical protein
MQTWELRDELRLKLVAFSWDQWTQMGLSGRSDRRDLWAADPEGLLVLSLVVSRHEPRLFDEILDWMTLNLRLISIQRLRNLTRHHNDVVRRLVDAALAWSSTHAKDLTRRAPTTPRVPPEPQTLFRIEGREAMVGKTDSTFADFGFRRPSTGPSGKSRVPDLAAPINLGFRLREIFGVGSRSEVTRILLTSPGDRLLGELAEAAAYAPRNVRETLHSLVGAGILQTSHRAKSRSYRVDRARWGQFIGIGEQDVPVYVAWVQLLRALTKIHVWLEGEADVQRSIYMQASEARRLMDEVRPDLLAADFSVQDARLRGAEYWPAFVEDVQAVLRTLEGPPGSLHP